MTALIKRKDSVIPGEVFRDTTPCRRRRTQAVQQHEGHRACAWFRPLEVVEGEAPELNRATVRLNGGRHPRFLSRVGQNARVTIAKARRVRRLLEAVTLG